MSKKETVVGEIGLGSHVRFQIPHREDGRPGFMEGLSASTVNGLTGVVVRVRNNGIVTVRLDDQSGTHGWQGDTYRQGDPDNADAYCYYMNRAGLVLIGDQPTPEPESTPEPNPEADAILEFKKKIYAKAIELVRTEYGGYGRQVQEWLTEVNMAPSAATYRLSGDLKYRSSRYGGIPSMEGILGERLSNLSGAKVEVVEMTFPAPKPGETVETLTADMFALVERVVARGHVCAEARVFIRKLGLRAPRRKSTKVELDLKLNAAELAALSRDGVTGLLNLVRDREAATERLTGVRVVEDKPAAKRAPRKATKAAAPKPETEATSTVRARSAIEEAEQVEAVELATAR